MLAALDVLFGGFRAPYEQLFCATAYCFYSQIPALIVSVALGMSLRPPGLPLLDPGNWVRALAVLHAYARAVHNSPAMLALAGIQLYSQAWVVALMVGALAVGSKMRTGRCVAYWLVVYGLLVAVPAVVL